MIRISIRLSFLLLIIIVCAASTGHALTAVIICPSEQPEPPVWTGMEAIEKALAENGWDVQRRLGPLTSDNSAADLEIVTSVFDSAKAASFPGADILRDIVSTAPESLSVSIFPRGDRYRAYAVGSDPIGAMYAAFELAEQIETGAPETPVPQRIAPKKSTPSITVRGIKLMLHRQALEDPLSWFHTEKYWDGLLDAIARSRFNYMEIHGIYDLMTAEFYNLFPYFAVLSAFPSIGVGEQQAEKNLKVLQRIIIEAHKRGINASLVNHNSSWSIPDKSAPPQEFNALLKYNAEAFRRLLQDCPMLDGYGFAIGESRNSTEFYKQAILQEFAKKERPLILFLPAYLADRKQFGDITENHQGVTVAEVKFNGDQAPFPYPVSGGRMADWGGYSYQDYFNLPRRYNVIFDLHTSGTHRLLAWGNYDFVKQTIQNTSFGGANGFVVETPSTYYPQTDEYTSAIQLNLRYYDWTYERDWYWFLLWGRLGYNPNEPPETFIKLFERHFGPGAGAPIYQALQDSGSVVPAIASVYGLGPDMRNLAPELELPASFTAFFEARPFDSSRIRSVTEEAIALATGQIDGRLSPFNLLQDAATGAERASAAIREAESVLTQSLDKTDESNSPAALQRYREWNAISLDMEILSALGNYYRDAVNTALQMGLYQLTGDASSLVLASQGQKAMLEDWERLAQTGENHYRPLMEPLRMKTAGYHWRQAKPAFEQDQAILSQLYNEWLDKTEWQPQFAHFRLFKSPPLQSILLTLSIPPKIKTESLAASFKNSAGETGRLDMKATRIDGVYFAEIPAAFAVDGNIEYFFQGTIGGQEITIPDRSQNAPFHIAITSDDYPPQIITLEHQVGDGKSRATVKGVFEDPAIVASARLFWKPLPSDENWSEINMERSGDTFTASFPLTPAGAIYFVDLSDGYGNAARYPTAAQGLPYRVIPPFAAAKDVSSPSNPTPTPKKNGIKK
ncbi:MAG: hypothetical protein AB1656_17365 [Candidatus Omnitrophota bacterium]